MQAMGVTFFNLLDSAESVTVANESGINIASSHTPRITCSGSVLLHIYLYRQVQNCLSYS